MKRAPEKLASAFKLLFDIVHVHTPVAAFIGRLAAHRAGVECIVYTAHGFYFHDHMATWKQKVFIFLEKWAGKYTDILFTQAQEDAITAKQLNLCPKGIVEAIGNGVNAEKFLPVQAGDQDCLQLRDSINTSSHDIVIMITGRLVAEKGYNELFSAMRGQNAILWVAGSRLSSDHALAVDTSNIPPNVRLLGHREDIPELLRASNIFVLPSHREGMPRSIIEAMMVGLPVIATDIRGSREEVVPGETGLIVPVLDQAALAMAITTLVNDQDLRRKMGIAGRKRALELYSEDKVIKRQMTHLQLTC